MRIERPLSTITLSTIALHITPLSGNRANV